jgi:menaquinone-dependent protoporphyrinogen oxidase
VLLKRRRLPGVRRKFCADRLRARKKRDEELPTLEHPGRLASRASHGNAHLLADGTNPATAHRDRTVRDVGDRTMKRVLVLYATVEGQSQRVAEHAARRLTEKGMGVRILDVCDVRHPFALQDYSAALLVAPVHASFHPRDMVRFASEHREELATMPARLLSLSLSQAGVELPSATAVQRERACVDVQHLITLFCKATGFASERVTPIAGCLAYSRYGFVKRQMMRYIASRAGGSTDTSRDHDYTDYARVDQALDQLCEGRVSEQANATAQASAH